MEVYQPREWKAYHKPRQAASRSEQNYQGISGKTIDELWGLGDLKYLAPSWHAYHIPGAAPNPDGDEPPPLVPYSGNGKQANKPGAKKRLAITSGYDSDGSMPSLQTVSDSSDEVDFSDEDDEDDESEYETDEEDSDFDEEFEDHIRDMVREAMDIAQADPDFNDPRAQASVFEDMSADKKDNPFLKLLGSLRGIMTGPSYSQSIDLSFAGRLFSGNAAIKTTDRAQPRHPYTGAKPPPEAYKPVAPSAKATAAKKAKGQCNVTALVV